MLNFLDMKVNGHGKGHTVNKIGKNGKASSQGMHIWNIVHVIMYILWFKSYGKGLKFSDM